jgi:hypothetical protein
MLNFIRKKPLIKKILLRLYSFLNFFGIDLAKVYFLSYLPKFALDLIKFKRLKGIVHNIRPILSNYSQKANLMTGHYFHQDLIVANKIYENNPKKHVDIGSRVDGFVSHVASFRVIETYDLRDIGKSKHKNIKINKVDITNGDNLTLKTDSLSCLHSIEHFGLGRYGDKLDPNGHIKGFQNLLNLLEKNGVIYISFPISTKTRVEFNEQRVFCYSQILDWLKLFKDEYILENFDYIDDDDNIHFNVDISKKIEKLRFGCGIYTIRKK